MAVVYKMGPNIFSHAINPPNTLDKNTCVCMHGCTFICTFVCIKKKRETERGKKKNKNKKKTSWKIQGSLNKFPDYFRMATFIDSTHIKLSPPSKISPPAAMHLLYRSNNFWKALWKSSYVSVSMTFVTTSFLSSIVP